MVINMEIPDIEFERILRHVPRSYDDFVIGLTDCTFDNDDVRKNIIQFISDHPAATPSDISKYYFDNFWNEEDDYDEDTIFYDDEDEI